MRTVLAALLASLGLLLAALPARADLTPNEATSLAAARAGDALLARGSRGAAVVALQTALARALGRPLAADGVFGPRTEAAVRAFQASAGLVADGVVGPLTVAALEQAPAADPGAPAGAAPPPGAFVNPRCPPRPAGAEGGRAFVARIAPLPRARRDEEAVAALEAGNLPEALRTLHPVAFRARDAGGAWREVTVWVTPDYLAVGSDADFVRAPLSADGAQRVADRLGCVLPTVALVDAIWAAAPGRLSPIPLPPGPTMMSAEYAAEHQRRIEAQREARGLASGVLLAGHKKDVVLSARLWARPDRVAIYGWHRPDGRPIQPLSTVHERSYADYSHGARLVWATCRIDGIAHPIEAVLADPLLAPLLSHEGPLPAARLPAR